MSVCSAREETERTKIIIWKIEQVTFQLRTQIVALLLNAILPFVFMVCCLIEQRDKCAFQAVAGAFITFNNLCYRDITNAMEKSSFHVYSRSD
jgi:hypothetical protein